MANIAENVPNKRSQYRKILCTTHCIKAALKAKAKQNQL